jgi:cold shock CspA family protein
MTDEHVIGCVKWFNKKSGFGFITIMEGSHGGSDIFVHHSGVTVSKDQYKYLVQGEYVQVAVTAGTGKHQHQSSNVTGVKGGKLMCETRSDMKFPGKVMESEPPIEPVKKEAPPVSEAPFIEKTKKPRVRKPSVKGK